MLNIGEYVVDSNNVLFVLTEKVREHYDLTEDQINNIQYGIFMKLVKSMNMSKTTNKDNECTGCASLKARCIVDGIKCPMDKVF